MSVQRQGLSHIRANGAACAYRPFDTQGSHEGVDSQPDDVPSSCIHGTRSCSVDDDERYGSQSSSTPSCIVSSTSRVVLCQPYRFWIDNRATLVDESSGQYPVFPSPVPLMPTSSSSSGVSYYKTTPERSAYVFRVTVDDTLTHSKADTGHDNLQATAIAQKESRVEHRRIRRREASYKTALDNKPNPFHIDERSFDVLRDRLWAPNTPLPTSFICQFDGCGKSVVTDKRRLRAHLIDHHNIAPGTVNIRCKWTNGRGETCGTRTASRNYRTHVLDFHLRALKGRCIVCSKGMTNPNAMKRHLKHCLRERTIDHMWKYYRIRIVRRAFGNGRTQEYSHYIPLAQNTA